MRKLLSLRRDETPIIGEVYQYKGDYLKCVADNCSAAEGCEKCYFYTEGCGGLCDGGYGATPRRHFKVVPGSEAETAADVKFRHVEETKGAPPLLGERFIAAVGLVEYVERPKNRPDECVLCDLTQRECDRAVCGTMCFYQKVKQ
jgi:hypothetical protein